MKKYKVENKTIIRVIDLSLLMFIISHSVPYTIEALINLGALKAYDCNILVVGCNIFDFVVIDVPRLFYLVPLFLASYASLIIAFFRPVLPSWLFVIISAFFIAMLYRYGNYALSTIVYLYVLYFMFRAVFIYQEERWPNINLKNMIDNLIKNYKRILLFLALSVSVAIFLPLLADRVYIELVDCEKTFRQYCSERRIKKTSDLYQAFYLLPIMVLSFIGLYRDERRCKTRLFIT